MIVLLIQIMMVHSYIVFLVHPKSLSVIDGSTAMFTCRANNTDDIDFRINGTSASSEDIYNKGFNQYYVQIKSFDLTRNLSVSIVSSMYNNTLILCEADGLPGSLDQNSNTAILSIQGI